MSGWIEKLAGKGKRGGSGVLVQIAREVVGRKRSLQGAISEVRHPAVLDALADEDFRMLDELIVERVESDREFAQVLARLTHAAAHAKGFDRQTVDAALRLDALLPSDDPAREREKLLGDAYRAAQRAGYVQGGRRALAKLGQRAASAGEAERARMLLQQQVDLGPEGADGEDEVDSAILLGDLLRRDGDANRALDLYERAGRSAARMGYVRALAPALLRQIDMKRGSLAPEDLILLQQDALDAVTETGDDAVRATLIIEIAQGFMALGRFDEAEQQLEDGLAFARDIGDMRLEQDCLTLMSEVDEVLGRHQPAPVPAPEPEAYDDEPEESYAAFAPTRRSADPLAEATELVNAGRLDQARVAFEDVLASAAQRGDLATEQRAAGGLGVTYSQLNRPVEALNQLMRALEIARAQGDERHEAQWLGSIGEALWKFGQLDDGIQAIQQGFTVAHRAGDRDLEAGMLGLLGRILVAEHRTSEAEECYERAIGIYRQLGDTQEEISMLSAMGAIAMDDNRPHDAMTLYGDALEIAAQSGERASAVRLYGRLARLAQRQGDTDAAVEALEQAVELAETVDQPALLSQALQHLAVTQDELGMSEALDTYERALKLVRELGDDYAESMLLVNVGARMLADGDKRGATQILRYGLSLIENLGVAGDRLRDRAERLLTAATTQAAPRRTANTFSARAEQASRRVIVRQQEPEIRRSPSETGRAATPVPQDYSTEASFGAR